MPNLQTTTMQLKAALLVKLNPTIHHHQLQKPPQVAQMLAQNVNATSAHVKMPVVLQVVEPQVVKLLVVDHQVKQKAQLLHQVVLRPQPHLVVMLVLKIVAEPHPQLNQIKEVVQANHHQKPQPLNLPKLPKQEETLAQVIVEMPVATPNQLETMVAQLNHQLKLQLPNLPKLLKLEEAHAPADVITPEEQLNPPQVMVAQLNLQLKPQPHNLPKLLKQAEAHAQVDVKMLAAMVAQLKLPLKPQPLNPLKLPKLEAAHAQADVKTQVEQLNQLKLLLKLQPHNQPNLPNQLNQNAAIVMQEATLKL
jgi:hypothetical protein